MLVPKRNHRLAVDIAQKIYSNFRKCRVLDVQEEYPFFARDMVAFLANITIYTSNSHKSEEGITPKSKIYSCRT
jgi:hypothetical protein